MERIYYDLTAAQQILFYSQKYTIHKQVNNVCTSILMNKELDFGILKKAIEKAYERNDSFRLRIVKIGKDLKQYFAEHEKPSIGYLDFTGQSQEAMEKRLFKMAHKPIFAYGKPLSRIYMMHSCDGRSGIYFDVCHMIMDSWGITTFFKDILAIYNNLSNGMNMPKPLVPYEKLLINELNYTNTEAYRKDRDFWEKALSTENPIFTHVNGSQVLEKYRMKKKKPYTRYCSVLSLRSKADNKMLLFPKELVSKMETYCSTNNIPMQTLVLMAFRSYLSKVNKHEKSVGFHTVIARRGTLTEKNTGGSRVHFMPFITIFEESDTFKKSCEAIMEKQSSIYRHVEINPLEVMNMWKKFFNVPQIGTFFAGSVTFQPVKLVSPEGTKIETKWYGNGTASQPLYITVMDGDGDGSLKFYYEYQIHQVTFETIRCLHSYMMMVIEAGITNDEITVGELLRLGEGSSVSVV